jgi:hypothetical protein
MRRKAAAVAAGNASAFISETDEWVAVADEIRCGRCNVRLLRLEMNPGSGIRWYGLKL